MQPYNNYFPATYQSPIVNPYQQNMYQNNYQQSYQQPVQNVQPVQQPQQQNQAFTLPTIHAEIVQVDNEQTAMNYPVAVGTSQMMIAKDDSAIFVKTAYPNGQSNLDVYPKRIPETNTETSDLNHYVTTDMLEKRLQDLLNGLNRQQNQQRKQQINQTRDNKETKVKENE